MKGEEVITARHLDEEAINLFLDGMLDRAARKRAENHLATCATCLAELARGVCGARCHGTSFSQCARTRIRRIRYRRCDCAVKTFTTSAPPRLLDVASGTGGCRSRVAHVDVAATNGMGGRCGWLVVRASDSAGWLELLWGVFIRPSGWMGGGLSSLWEGISPTVPAGVTLLQGGLAMTISWR